VSARLGGKKKNIMRAAARFLKTLRPSTLTARIQNGGCNDFEKEKKKKRKIAYENRQNLGS